MNETILMRDAFGKTLAELGTEFRRLVVVDADLGVSTKSAVFRDRFPDRFVQVGVAEQNMAAVAAGLAYAGMLPFAVTFASFFKRALDQVRMLIAQPAANVKLMGCYCGLCSGLSGKSHQTVQDIAIMRSMPNMRVVSPLDTVEMASVMRWACVDRGPCYIRLVRGPTPVVFTPGTPFTPGKAVFLRQGKDVTIISTGCQTVQALEAAQLLAAEGIEACVLHVSWIKPLDIESVVKAAALTRAVVTVEEHTVLGGLGGAVTEVLSEYYPVKVRRMGLDDEYARSGSYSELLDKYGLSAMHIVSACREMVKKTARRKKLFLEKPYEPAPVPV